MGCTEKAIHTCKNFLQPVKQIMKKILQIEESNNFKKSSAMHEFSMSNSGYLSPPGGSSRLDILSGDFSAKMAYESQRNSKMSIHD